MCGAIRMGAAIVAVLLRRSATVCRAERDILEVLGLLKDREIAIHAFHLGSDHAMADGALVLEQKRPAVAVEGPVNGYVVGGNARIGADLGVRMRQAGVAETAE